MNIQTLPIRVLSQEAISRWLPLPKRQVELFVWLGLILGLNLPVLLGSSPGQLMLVPGVLASGEWWRLVTHPFVHVTWYHLLLDGAGFLILYHSLQERSLLRRLGYVAAGAWGAAAISWWGTGLNQGLCGLSGTAHGLMAVSAVEMVRGSRTGSDRTIGWVTLWLVIAKAGVEAATGRMFLEWLHFGLMGTPVAVSHAGGVIGALLTWLLLSRGSADICRPPSGEFVHPPGSRRGQKLAENNRVMQCVP
jgi:rhomboid family GlyGly-CTERM serine protease